MSTWNIIMSTSEFAMLPWDWDLCHVNIFMLHVNINKLHANIIILHVDIIYFACKGQKYTTIHLVCLVLLFFVCLCACLFLSFFGGFFGVFFGGGVFKIGQVWIDMGFFISRVFFWSKGPIDLISYLCICRRCCLWCRQVSTELSL